ncbi:TonB-dependent receptor domain-containing protein [Bartonella apis]|uniref:TonB-dependent receptor domain-containing protein n=1 Tax=Bartonella apis TaxID=1686310 RepID=UPI0026EB3811|nr:TonB-dependent receptor [Bartonella apis]
MSTGRVEGKHFSDDQGFSACQNVMTETKILKSHRNMAAQSFRAENESSRGKEFSAGESFGETKSFRAENESGRGKEFSAGESLSGAKGFSASRKMLVALACSSFFSTSLFFNGTAFAETVNNEVKIAKNGKESKPSIAKKKQNATGEKAESENSEAASNSAASADNPAPLADEGTMLRQVVVSATGFEQNVKDAPASISVIPREEIEKGSFRDLTDALRNVQGVAVTGTAAEQDIFIRGLPGAYTLILVDGKRQSTREARTNGNSGFEQSFIPPAAAIERIEVVRGPMSSLYGSDAMGGVINIITRKVPHKWTGSFTIDGTANQYSKFGNTAQGSYYVGGPVAPDVVGLQLWGRGLGREEDDIISGTPKKKEIDITGKVTVTPDENNDLTFEAGHTRLRRYSSVGHNIERTENISRAPVDTYNKNDRDHWVVGYTGRYGFTTADFSVLQETASRTNYTWDSPTHDYVANLRSPEIRNTVVDGKFTTPFDIFGRHTLVTGGQFNRGALTDQNPGMRTGLDEEFTIEQWAGFAEDEWWLTDTFSLTGGVRMDHHQIYGEHWSPRGYAVWHATDNLVFKGGVSTGFKAPEIREIAPGYAYTTGGGNCFYGRNPPKGRNRCGVIIGADNLEAEKSTSYEFSAIWDNLDNLELGATYFYTDFKDKITNRQILDSNGNPVEWSVDPNYVLYENLNIDDAVMQGVELTGSWKPIDVLTIRSNYTYTHSEQKSGDYEGLPLARTPKHIANLRAEWQTPIEKLESFAAATYHGKETNAGFRTGTAGKAVYKNGKIVGREYDDYVTFDIGGSYAFSENVKLNAAIYNLFDKRVGVDQFNDVVEGRRLWLSMNSQF